MVHVDLKSSFKVKVGEHQAPVAVAVVTWLAQQPQSEVDVVLLVRLSVRPVRVHVDHRLAAHVEQETCNKTTTYKRKYFPKMGNIFRETLLQGGAQLRCYLLHLLQQCVM